MKLSKVDPYRSAFPGSVLPENNALGGSLYNQALIKKQSGGGGIVPMIGVQSNISGGELAMLSG